MEVSTNKYLAVVNQNFPIPDDFLNSLILLPCMNVSGTISLVEWRTFRAFNTLRKALRRDGIVIGIESAYRSVEQQRELYESFCHRFGEAYAASTVAIPGYSEHHTGLAIDIVPRIGGRWIRENSEMMRETETFFKIHTMLPECGLILRYPAGKEEITGYPYEPWHFRFVGERAAREILQNSMCMEEYLHIV